MYRLDGESLTLVHSTTETDNTTSVAWSPDGRYLSVGNDGQVNRLYRIDAETLTLVHSTTETDNTTSVEWSPDGRYLAVGNDGHVNRLYRLDGESLTLIHSTTETDNTTSVEWSPNGRYLAVGIYGLGNRSHKVEYKYDTSPQGFVNGIVFGNSALGSAYDIDLNILASARIDTFGSLMYDNVN